MSSGRKKSCPTCGGPMDSRTKGKCSQCTPSGRPQSDNFIYAQELGLTRMAVKRLGGAEKLRKLSPEARAVLLKPLGNGHSHEILRGGLAARGMKSLIPARVTNPPAMYEELMSEADFGVLSVEGLDG